MNDNDRNLYIESLEEENQTLRRELREYKNDVRELALIKFKYQKECNYKQDVDLSKFKPKAWVKFIKDHRRITIIRLDINLTDEFNELDETSTNFLRNIKNNGIFGINPDDIKLEP